ncbi:EAL domain-containing protein [Brenneria populi]|uniref:EAL domain-containing protein n=1 Tax=Brenneria populi TaxID=1505588 RepID=A0ABU6JU20_9GAMM|nr:EAL domain-containing protein [Brenneria populi Li et al. 2015]
MNNKIVIPKSLSRNDISISYVFQKMFSPQGKLVAVECLTRFYSTHVSSDYFFRNAGNRIREVIFMEQLALIEKYKNWFLENNIYATINVDDHTLTLLHDNRMMSRIQEIGCVHFEINEYSNSLINDYLPARKDMQTPVFWLDDFGSGYAGMNIIGRYHFDFIKIDKDTFWYLMKKESGKQLMKSLITFLYNNKHKVIIEGVENEEHKQWLQGMDWFAIQGHYWKEVSIDELIPQ